MAQPYVGEIRIFAGTFAPAGWMDCDGTLLSISENEVLFQLIGTTYGGDGQENFALPDLRSRVPIHMGGGFILAETGGVEQVTLTTAQIPSHNHAEIAATNNSQFAPGGNVLGTATSTQGGIKVYDSVLQAATTTLVASTIGPAGGSQPHTNIQPYLCLRFIISLFGLFPSQT